MSSLLDSTLGFWELRGVGCLWILGSESILTTPGVEVSVCPGSRTNHLEKGSVPGFRPWARPLDPLVPVPGGASFRWPREGQQGPLGLRSKGVILAFLRGLCPLPSLPLLSRERGAKAVEFWSVGGLCPVLVLVSLSLRGPLMDPLDKRQRDKNWKAQKET